MSESSRSKRSSSISSQRGSRPPSLSYTNSRTNSEISILGDTIVEGQASQSVRPSYLSQWSAMGSNAAEAEPDLSPKNRTDRPFEPPNPEKTHGSERTSSLTKLASPPPQVQNTSYTNTRPTQDALPSQRNAMSDPSKCTCGCHDVLIPSQQAPPPLPPPPPKPVYANATTQTSPPPSPPPRRSSNLRIDTTASTAPYWSNQNNYTAIAQHQDDYYYEEEDYEAPPVLMGRMSSYFNKPGYQLGDSLFSGYQPINWGATYVYQDSFGEEALR
jgi:hypothetical protein